MQEETISLTVPEMKQLRWAYKQLEHPSLAARMSNLLAGPIEEMISMLPKTWQNQMSKTLKANTYRTLRLALFTMLPDGPARSQNLFHQMAAIGTGLAGGYVGPLALLVELPVTTTFIIRSIANIARSQGEDLRQLEARMACVYTFALGARTKEDESADVGYYALRTLLGFHFERDILEYAANASGPHIPYFIDLTRAIAARFGVMISDITAARMVPIAGAVSGATLNLIFMNHFQNVAKGHFIVRRLERKYGVDVIKGEYQGLLDEEQEAEKEFSPIEGW